jgi:hypothetical protein
LGRQKVIGTRPPKSMAADARPKFEVAAIKPSQSRDLSGSLNVNPSGPVNVTNFPVLVLIQFSYSVTRHEISGGPSWLESERFDIVGKPDIEGAPDMSQPRVTACRIARPRRAGAHRNVARFRNRRNGTAMERDRGRGGGWGATYSGAESLSPLLLVVSIAGEKGSAAILGPQMKLVAASVASVDLKDTGHWLMEERPEETMDALIAFL